MSGRRREALLRALETYRPAAGDEDSLSRFRAFLARADPFRRSDPHGHVTASAVVARPSGNAYLLVYHRKLDRWLQPGGHVEPEDASVFDAAVREAKEETGIGSLAAPLDDRILDLDVHAIPAFGGEPAHRHYDVRYLLTTTDGANVPAGVAWFPLETIGPADLDGSLSRAIRKAATRLSGR